MSSSNDLLRGILADPDDDALRLVYADALMARGDPRGELIVTEHRLAQQPTPELVARRNELRRTHGGTWWPELPTYNVRTRCGFVDAIAAPVDQLPNLVSLFAREPIRELELFGAAVDAEVIAALPPLRGLAAHSLAPSGLMTLLGSELASLDIASAPIHDVDLGAGLRACRQLNIAQSGFWIEDLMSWAHLDMLRELDISVSDVDTPELAPLLRRTPRLETLRASGNPLGDVVTHEVANVIAELRSLRHLEVVDCGLDEEIMSEALPRLVIVDRVDHARHTIDLVGSRIDLVRHGDLYAIHVDGEPRRIRFSAGPVPAARPIEAEAAELRDLVIALAHGYPRTLVHGGAEIESHNVHARITIDEGPVRIHVEYTDAAG